MKRDSGPKLGGIGPSTVIVADGSFLGMSIVAKKFEFVCLKLKVS